MRNRCRARSLVGRGRAGGSDSTVVEFLVECGNQSSETEKKTNPQRWGASPTTPSYRRWRQLSGEGGLENQKLSFPITLVITWMCTCECVCLCMCARQLIWEQLLMISNYFLHILFYLTITITQLQCTDKETKTKMTCPRSCGYQVIEPRANSRFLLSNSFSCPHMLLLTIHSLPLPHTQTQQCDLQQDDIPPHHYCYPHSGAKQVVDDSNSLSTKEKDLVLTSGPAICQLCVCVF